MINFLKNLLKYKKNNYPVYQEDDSFLDYASEDYQDQFIDPKKEAEIYIAYYQFYKAIEILYDAIEKYPKRKDLVELLKTIDNLPSSSLDLLKNIKSKKIFLISLIVEKANCSCQPENFKIILEESESLETKIGQEILFKEIQARNYKSWAILSHLEIKDQ